MTASDTADAPTTRPSVVDQRLARVAEARQLVRAADTSQEQPAATPTRPALRTRLDDDLAALRRAVERTGRGRPGTASGTPPDGEPAGQVEVPVPIRSCTADR
jgi:hypothetical protein